MSRIYKARKAQTGVSNKTGEPFIQYSIALPSDLAQKIIDEYGDESLAFEIELTAKGVLYKLVTAPDLDLEGELPFKPSPGTGKARQPRKAPAAKAAPKPAAKKPAVKKPAAKATVKKAAPAKAKAPVKAPAKAKVAAKPKAKVAVKAKAPRVKATA